MKNLGYKIPRMVVPGMVIRRMATSGIMLSVLLLMGCSRTLTVQTDYDREADFSQYRTFYWSDDFQNQNNNDNNEPLFYNTLVKKRLKQAIEKTLEGKGYTLSPDNPDLLVKAQVVVEQRSDNRNAYPYYNPFYFGYYGGFNGTTGSQKEGDVVIDLIDRERKQLIWQGYAPGVLETNTKDRQEELNDAVTMILSKYDHRAGTVDTPQANTTP